MNTLKLIALVAKFEVLNTIYRFSQAKFGNTETTSNLYNLAGEAHQELEYFFKYGEISNAPQVPEVDTIDDDLDIIPF